MRKYHTGGGLGPLLFFLILLSFISRPAPADAGRGGAPVRLLYFFNTSCSHCNQIKTFIFGLSKEYTIEGWISSDQDVKDYPFPVKVGSREMAPKYSVFGVPSAVVLRGDRFVQLVAGSDKIEKIRPLLRALDAGALTVTEALEEKPGAEVVVAGFTKVEGKTMKDARVFLVGHAGKLAVSSWLPKEAVKSRFSRRRPRTMAQVAGAVVALRGKLVKNADGNLRLQVLKEMHYDGNAVSKGAQKAR